MSSTVAPAPSARAWLTLAVVLTTQMMIVLDAAIVNIGLLGTRAGASSFVAAGEGPTSLG